MAEEQVIYCSESVPEWKRRFVQELQEIQEEPEAVIVVILDESHDARVLGWSPDFPRDAVIAAGHLMGIAQRHGHFPGGLSGLMRMILEDPDQEAEIITGEDGNGDN